MRSIPLILAAIILSGKVHAADLKADIDKDFVTVARWGVCLVDVVGEDRAKSAVHGKVAAIDADYYKRHGRRATDVAQELHGDNFVVYYYQIAKAEHDRLGDQRDAYCAVQDKNVSALGR